MQETKTIYFTLEEAVAVCKNYQWLKKGFKFDSPNGILTIDKVLPLKHRNGKYTPMVMHDIFTPPEIPEFYGFKNPAQYLIDYLDYMEIPFFPMEGNMVLCDICRQLPEKDENGIDKFL